MSGKKLILDEEFIKLQHSLGKSANYIALELNVSNKTILKAFKNLKLFSNFKLGSSKQCVKCKEIKSISEFHWKESKRNSKANDHYSATFDKIIPEKGYIPGNVIIISRLANTMKNNANLKEIKNFCNNMIKVINVIETQGALGNITDVFPDLKIIET